MNDIALITNDFCIYVYVYVYVHMQWCVGCVLYDGDGGALAR